MEFYPLAADDHALIAAAPASIGRLYRPDQHHVGAALRSASGQVFSPL